MPQTVHLQYNSPMGLYSKEAAVEQFQQQIGETPSDLPAADKHFDPSRSATLKYLKESENENFGENFFEKVAQAEAPNVPYQSEPGWARTAREKSERARSRTPADPLHGSYRPASSPAPSNHPVHLETAREHADKNSVFTHNINEPYGRPYYEAAHGLQKHRRSHSAGRELNRGYELGGLDFTGGVHIDHGTDYQYYEEPQRKPQPPKLPPGYELGGTDFYQGHVSGNTNYRGHGPDPPRLRPKYTADPHDPCNVAMAPNIEGVDANLLVGDTLSNQKIKHEVRHIDQTHFGTSFGPPQGFNHSHTTVHRRQESPKPVVYSLSANKNLARSQSVPRSSAPPEQRDVWNSQQYETDKEVSIRTLLNDEALRVQKRETSPYWADHSQQKHEAWNGKVDPRLQRYETYITEPNWRRNVDQRRLAWERRAFETEQRLSRPFSEKVAPGAPPAWHSEAQYKHQQWQQQADNMNGNYNQTQYTPYNQQYQQPQQHFNESRQYNQTTTTTNNGYAPQQSHQTQHYQNTHNGSTNAQNVLNSGYNSNQVDYVLSHKDKYNEGPHYQPPIINSSATANNNSSSYSNQYSSSSYNQSNTNNAISNQAIPLGGPLNNNSSYSSETRITGTVPNQGLSSQNYHSSSYNSSSTNTRTVPVQQQQASNYQQSSNYEKTSSHKSVQFLPVFRPIFKPHSFFEENHFSHNSETENFHRDFNSPFSRTVPIHVEDKTGTFNEIYKTYNRTTEKRSVEPVPIQSTVLYNEKREEEEREERRETRSQSVPAVITSSSSHQEYDVHSEKSYATSVPIPLPPPQNYQNEQESNYNKSYNKTTTTTTTTSQPVVQPTSNNYSSNYHTVKTSSHTTSQPQPQPISIAAPQNYSTSYHTETHSTTGPIHSPGGQSFKSTEFSRNYNKQETTTTTTTQQQPTFQTTHQPISRTTTYNYNQREVPTQVSKPTFHQESFTSHTEKNSSNSIPQHQPASYQYENYLSSRKEESRREETSRPVSQISNYSENRSYKRNYEEKTETKTVPATNVTYKDLSNAQSVDDVFNKRTEMNESLPIGSISNTHNNTEGGYRDVNGHDVSYKRETQTSADPGRETALLKEEEKRVVETPLEPGVISRHVTTKYYKKKTVTDTTTTTE